MSSAKLLDPVRQTYNISRDCLKIARRSVSSGDLRRIDKTGFIGLSVPQAEKEIESSMGEIEDFAIIGFWARFERYLVEYSQNIAKEISAKDPMAFSRLLHSKIDKDIEYWKTDDLLDVFKGIVDPTLLGQAKQIKEYRDWIAHRNPKKLPSAKTDAKTTYAVLSKILSQIDREDRSGPDL